MSNKPTGRELGQILAGKLAAAAAAKKQSRDSLDEHGRRLCRHMIDFVTELESASYPGVLINGEEVNSENAYKYEIEVNYRNLWAPPINRITLVAHPNDEYVAVSGLSLDEQTIMRDHKLGEIRSNRGVATFYAKGEEGMAGVADLLFRRFKRDLGLD